MAQSFKYGNKVIELSSYFFSKSFHRNENFQIENWIVELSNEFGTFIRFENINFEKVSTPSELSNKSFSFKDENYLSLETIIIEGKGNIRLTELIISFHDWQHDTNSISVSIFAKKLNSVVINFVGILFFYGYSFYNLSEEDFISKIESEGINVNNKAVDWSMSDSGITRCKVSVLPKRNFEW